MWAVRSTLLAASVGKAVMASFTGEAQCGLFMSMIARVMLCGFIGVFRITLQSKARISQRPCTSGGKIFIRDMYRLLQ